MKGQASQELGMVRMASLQYICILAKHSSDSYFAGPNNPQWELEGFPVLLGLATRGRTNHENIFRQSR